MGRRLQWISLGILVGLSACIGAWLMLAPWSPRAFPQLLPKGKTLNVGHRGGASLAPENSMAAFQEAQRIGAHGVEFDVMLSADGHVVVFHDYTLDKRLPSSGRIRKMTLAQLRQIDISPYYVEQRPLQGVPPRFQPTRIPTLEEVFQFYQKHPKILLNIELKNEDLRDHGLESTLARMIRRFGFGSRVLISSFNPFAVRRFRLADPEIPRALIFSGENPLYIRKLWFLQLAQPDALHPQHELVTPRFMKWAHQKGYAVNPWTVNHPDDMKRMLERGVNAIVTDFPDILAGLLKTQK